MLLNEAMEYANLSIGKQLKYDKIMTTQIDIIARQMLAEQIPVETVAKCTGLSAEEIAALQ